MDDPSVETSLVESIAHSELSGLASDLADVGLDAILDDGLARDIPVVGTLMKMYSIATTVQNRLFAKKLLRFLAGLADVPAAQRRAQVAKLTVDVNERQKVGENLLLLLDRMNDMAKPAMMASAFKAYLEERIDSPQFQSLAHVIDSINMAAIRTLRDVYKRDYYPEVMEPDPHMQHLAMCGLFSIKFKKIDTTARFGNGGSSNEKPAGALAPNSLGQLFYDIVLVPTSVAT